MKKIKVTYADGNSSPKMNQFSAPWPVFYEVWNVLQSCKRTTTPMKTGQIIADYSSIGFINTRGRASPAWGFSDN